MAPSEDMLREGLAANLAGLLSDGEAVPAFPYLQYVIDAPATIVGPLTNSEPLKRLGSLSGHPRKARWTFPIRLLMGDSTELASQPALGVLIDWNDANGFMRTIESDPTLGGIAESVEVIRVSKETTFDVGSVSFYGIEATVEVVA